jgi:hypothetical protein
MYDVQRRSSLRPWGAAGRNQAGCDQHNKQALMSRLVFGYISAVTYMRLWGVIQGALKYFIEALPRRIM